MNRHTPSPSSKPNKNSRLSKTVSVDLIESPAVDTFGSPSHANRAAVTSLQPPNAAGSIKLFSFNRKYNHLLGIYPPQSNQEGPLITSRRRIFIITLFVLFALPSAAFFILEAKSMLEYGLSFFSASAGLFFMCLYLAIVRQMENTWPFFENFEGFIEQRENSIATYRDTIEKIERMCELYGIALFSTSTLTTLPFLLYTLINYYILDMGEDSFVLFFPMSWPFDWKTSLGYFVAWSCQFAGAIAMAATGTICLNFVFGSCWLFIVMAEDITKDVAAFNSDVNANKNRAEWMKRFCDIIQLYSDAKQLVTDFNSVVKHSLFLLIFWFMLSVTSMLLISQFQLVEYRIKIIFIFF